MLHVSALDLIIYAVASLLASSLSGIAGAGGGFIMTPLLIFLGLSPAQAVATGKLAGLSVSLGSIGGMKGTKIDSRRQLHIIMGMALLIGLIAPFIIIHLNGEIYRKILGFLLLAMIPILIFKKVGHTKHHPSTNKKIVGYILLSLSLFLQAVFSGGMGAMVNIVMMAFLGMSALTANVTKRYSQVILNTVIFIGVLFSGLIIWPIALVGVITAGMGGYIGGKLAVKRGNTFVMAIFIVLMILSAIGLIFGSSSG